VNVAFLPSLYLSCAALGHEQTRCRILHSLDITELFASSLDPVSVRIAVRVRCIGLTLSAAIVAMPASFEQGMAAVESLRVTKIDPEPALICSKIRRVR
jgi:hypothetical protein